MNDGLLSIKLFLCQMFQKYEFGEERLSNWLINGMVILNGFLVILVVFFIVVNFQELVKGKLIICYYCKKNDFVRKFYLEEVF